MSLAVRRLERGDVVEAFDCGDDDLNQYLQRFAWQNQQRHSVGITYVAVSTEAPRVVIGYYTLAASGIPKSWFPEDVGRRLSPYREAPVVLLARLAVDRRFQGRGVGELVLTDAIKRALRVREQVGCRCIVVDAYPGAVAWYERFGFVSIAGAAPGSATRRMYIDLRQARAALAEE